MRILTMGAVLLSTQLKAVVYLLAGAALIGTGVAGIGAGVAWLADRQTLFGVALIGNGVAVIGMGVTQLADRHTLFGAAVIGSGVAVIGAGVMVVDPSVITSAIRQLFDSATKAPQTGDDHECPDNSPSDLARYGMR